MNLDPQQQAAVLTEIWFPIKGFESYQISQLGNIKRISRGKGTNPNRPLKKMIDRGGYEWVNLTVKGKHYPKTVHILVLENFIGPRPTGNIGNHKNGKKTDNQISNLEWITKGEDISHAYRIGLRKRFRKLSEEKILQIKFMLSEGLFYHHQIAEVFGVSRTTISKINGEISRIQLEA